MLDGAGQNPRNSRTGFRALVLPLLLNWLNGSLRPYLWRAVRGNQAHPSGLQVWVVSLASQPLSAEWTSSTNPPAALGAVGEEKLGVWYTALPFCPISLVPGLEGGLLGGRKLSLNIHWSETLIVSGVILPCSGLANSDIQP